MDEREGGPQGDGVVQHASPHWESEEDPVQTGLMLSGACLLWEGKSPRKPSCPLAFARSSCKTLFSQSLVNVFLNSLPALVMMWVLPCPVQLRGLYQTCTSGWCGHPDAMLSLGSCRMERLLAKWETLQADTIMFQAHETGHRDI